MTVKSVRTTANSWNKRKDILVSPIYPTKERSSTDSNTSGGMFVKSESFSVNTESMLEKQSHPGMSDHNCNSCHLYYQGLYLTYLLDYNLKVRSNSKTLITGFDKYSSNKLGNDDDVIDTKGYTKGAGLSL